MFSIIVKSKDTENAKKRPSNFKRLRLVAAAAACILIATTAIAAAYIGFDTDFLKFFNVFDDKLTENLTNGAYIVDKKVTNRNGTLEIKQVLGDETTTYILMDFTAPKGTILNYSRYNFDSAKTDFDISDHNSSYGWGFRTIEDQNPNDNKISLIMVINSEYTTLGKRLSLKLTDLWAADAFPSEFEPVLKGTWKTSFPLDFKNISETYTIDKSITLYGEKLSLNKLSLSPISVNMYFTGEKDKIKNVFTKSEEETAAFDIIPITLKFEDGTCFTTTDENTNLFSLAKSYTCITNTKTFNQVIDIDKVISITIFNEEFQLQ